MKYCFYGFLLTILAPAFAGEVIFVARTLPEAERARVVALAEMLESSALGPVAVKPLPLWGNGGRSLWKVDHDTSPEDWQRFALWMSEELGFIYPVPDDWDYLHRPDAPVRYADWSPSRWPGDNGYLARRLSGLERALSEQSLYFWRLFNFEHEPFRYNHKHFRLIRPEHFDTHPQWFAKDERGRPIPLQRDRVTAFNHHPDLAHPEVVALVAEEIKERFRQSPEALSFSIGANDSYEFGHMAEDYPWRPQGYFRRYPDFSNHVFHFSNQVAEQVIAEFPDKYLGALAYMSWENVPDFPVHPRIVPYLTADRTQWYDHEFREEDLALVREWSQAGPEIIGTWDYFFSYGFLFPRSLVGLAADSITALYEAGVRAYHSQIGPHWALDNHVWWLMKRLLADVDADADALLDAYFVAWYGEAADEMRAFFDHAEQIWMNQPGRSVWLRYWIDAHQAYLYTEADLRYMRARLDAAQAVATGAALRRIGAVADFFELTELFVEMVHWKWLISAGDRGPVVRTDRDSPPFDWDIPNLGTVEGTEAAIARLDDLEERFEYLRRELPRQSNWHNRLQHETWAVSSDPRGRARTRVGAGPEVVHPVRFEDVRPSDWRVHLLDTEDARIEFRRGGMEVENVRRSQVFHSFPVEAGEWYQAKVYVRGQVGPSSTVFVRLDWYDDRRRQISSTPIDRLPPGHYKEPFLLGPVAQAPENAAYGRLFIRVYEQEPGDGVVVE